MSPLAALIVDVVMTAFWPIIGKSGVARDSGLLFTQAGLVVGLAALSPLLAARGRWRRIVDPSVAPSLAAIGFFSSLGTTFFISAMVYTTPANAAIMAQIEVLYSALMCAWLLRERVTTEQGAASALIIAGTGLIMAHDLRSPRWRGDLMVLATPWLYQVSHIFAKKLPRKLDPVVITGGRLFYGLLWLAPLVAWAAARGARWSWQPQALGAVLAQGLAMSCLNFLLWYHAIGGMDLSKATAIILAYPALTVLFSWLLGRETVRAVQLVGLSVTVSGAYWMSRLVLQAQAAAGTRPAVEPEAAPEV